MRARIIPLVRWRGFHVRVDPALPPSLVYIGWLLAQRYSGLQTFSPILQGEPRLGPVAWAAVVTVGVLIGLLLHEAAHVAAARRAGARPLGLTLAFLGGGCSYAAPAGRSPEVEWQSALAGPIASLALGLAALGVAQVFGIRQADVHMALDDFGRFQLGFAAVSLIPAFPLDGGRLVRGLAARRVGAVVATRLAARLGLALAVACLAVALADRRLVFLFAAMALLAGALSDEQDEWLAAALHGLRAADAMLPCVGAVSPAEPLAGVAHRLLAAGASALPVLGIGGSPLGAISTGQLRQVPARRLAAARVGEMRRYMGVVPARADLAGVRRLMTRRRMRAVAVVDDSGRLAGVLSLRRIDMRLRLVELLAIPTLTNPA